MDCLNNKHKKDSYKMVQINLLKKKELHGQSNY